MLKICIILLIASGLTMAAPTANDSPTSAQVTSDAAFNSGVATRVDPKLDSGVTGSDTFQCYSGKAENFPTSEKWVSFNSMWKSNAAKIQSGCKANTPTQTEYIHDAILEVAKASLIDPRVGLAVVMQESSGCVNAPSTNTGVPNPGLMQSHRGASFVGNSRTLEEQKASITQMIVDGMQGTRFTDGEIDDKGNKVMKSGDGYVQLINQYGNLYGAARGYNSGSVTLDNLNDGYKGDPDYVIKVANRMTGWLGDGATPCK